jgi:hypothetical protein
MHAILFRAPNCPELFFIALLIAHCVLCIFRIPAQSFSDCLGGIIPALLSIVVEKSTEENGKIKQTLFFSKLKEMTKKDEGWAYVLVDSMLQDVREEYVLFLCGPVLFVCVVFCS